ncbi:substrate-binding domain-containing protein [Rubritalea tangerina]|uniref:Substrate-binding domain-containing protein n=2 Tax=Rubritalea tangerina TaxID=430798 RepID=A0ABW4ZCI9_9BACT
MNYMRTHGLWRIVTENDSYGEMEAVKIGVGWEGDGVILYRATQEELDDFKERGVAVVLLSSEGPGAGVSRVLPDNLAAGRMAAKHLLSLGVKHFAYLARGETFYKEQEFAPGIRLYARERLAGFKSGLEAASYEPQVHYLPGYPLWKEDTWREIEQTVGEFLSSLPSTTGLFVADDPLAAVVLRAASKVGIEVPRDLAVLGFGDDPNYCHASLPALSSIAYPAREVGYCAAEELDRLLGSEERGAQSSRIPVEGIRKRESTDFIAIDDEETAKLVYWIRLHAPHEPVQVNDLEDQSKYSLSSIKAKFRKYLGRSPKDEIKRVRLEHLQYLLKDATVSFTEVADMMQFSSAHEMSRFFLREKGERPSAYRERYRKAVKE